MISSQKWDDNLLIKDTLHSFKNKYENRISIITFGTNSITDSTIKKMCLAINIKYNEIPAYHSDWNAHCIEPAYKFRKPYNNKYLYMRNASMVSNIDVLVVFKKNDDESKLMDDIIKQCNKKNKKVLQISSKN